MGPLVNQVLVDGALLHPSSRGSCRDDVLEGNVYGLQLQALKKWREHADSFQREWSEVLGV
jgi:hypothetical protein